MKKREFLKLIGTGTTGLMLNPISLLSESKGDISRENRVTMEICTNIGSATIDNGTTLENSLNSGNIRILNFDIQDWYNILNFRDAVINSENIHDIDLYRNVEKFLGKILNENCTHILLLVNSRLYSILAGYGDAFILERDSEVQLKKD